MPIFDQSAINALYKVLADSDIMQHYPYAFDENRVINWIAAIAVRDWTFNNTPFQIVYYYMKYTNEPSVKTAISYGCKQVDEYKDDENEITKVFAISKDQWADLIRQL